MNNYIEVLYKESNKALKKNEMPVGAIIIKDNKIIARSHNNRQSRHNVLGHAEINCILKAEKKLKDWRLDGCKMYVNLKPCEMCQKIIDEARIDSVEYIIDNPNSKEIAKNIVRTNVCNEHYEMFEKQIKTFFKMLRK